MQPKKTRENPDLFRLLLDQFIDMKHELVILADKINWPLLRRNSAHTILIRRDVLVLDSSYGWFALSKICV